MNHNVLTRGLFDDVGLDGVGNGLAPSFANVCNVAAHAHTVNFAGGRQCAHHHRDAVFFTFAIHHVGKQKCLAIGLGDAAPKLPAHQGVQFGVFVNRTVNGDQQTLAVKFCQVLVQVGVAARRRLGGSSFAAFAGCRFFLSSAGFDGCGFFHGFLV